MTQIIPWVVPFTVVVCILELRLCARFQLYLFAINCSPKLFQKKKIDHRDHHTSLPSPWIEKQYCVLRMHMHHSPDNYDFYAQYRMCSTKLRNHLKAINQYLLYFKALHVICYWECLATMISNRLVQIAVAPFFVHLECYVT